MYYLGVLYNSYVLQQLKFIYHRKIYDLVLFLMTAKLNKSKDGLPNISHCKLDILLRLVITSKCLEATCFVFVTISSYMWVMSFDEKKAEKNIYMLFLEFFLKAF